jgi:phage terminase large subunit-like protein
MSSLVQGQHLSLQWFDREPEDISSIGTRGTHYVQQTKFWVVEVVMPLVLIAQV